MPTINILAILVAGFIPNALGALYYGPIAGKAWRSSLGKTEKELEPNNPAITYGGAWVLGLILSFFLNFILQMGHKDVNEAGELIIASHNTFPHGALHGAMIGLTIVTPVIVSLGMFHKANWKTNLLNVIFWVTAMAIMGGILDVWK